MQIGLVLAFPLHKPKVPGSRLGIARWVFVIQNLSDYIKSEKAKDWLRGAGQLSTALNDTPCIVKVVIKDCLAMWEINWHSIAKDHKSVMKIGEFC